MILVFVSARGDFRPESLGRGGCSIKTDEFASRGSERRHDAVKAVDERDAWPPYASARRSRVRWGAGARSSSAQRPVRPVADGGLRGPKETGPRRRSRLRIIGENGPYVWSNQVGDRRNDALSIANRFPGTVPAGLPSASNISLLKSRAERQKRRTEWW